MDGFTIEAGISTLETFRLLLEKVGVTQGILLGTVAIAFVALLISFREVAGWFFRLSHIREDLRTIQSQLGEMQKTVGRLTEKFENTKLDFIESTESKKAEAAEEKNPARPQFRLDH